MTCRCTHASWIRTRSPYEKAATATPNCCSSSSTKPSPGSSLEAKPGNGEASPFSPTPRGVAKITDLAARDGLRVAEINGRGVGAIVTGSAPDYVRPAQDAELYVLALISSRAHAGRGIGARLIDHAKQQARQMGCQQLRVDCWAGSPTLIGFYESAGFTKLDTFEVGDWSGQVLNMPVKRS